MHLTDSRVAIWLLVYSSSAILAGYLLGAIGGAGAETVPPAAGMAPRSAGEEVAIKVVAYSSALSGVIAVGLVLWGLRLGREGMAEDLILAA